MLNDTEKRALSNISLVEGAPVSQLLEDREFQVMQWPPCRPGMNLMKSIWAHVMWRVNSVMTLQQLSESYEWGSIRSGMKYHRIPWHACMSEWPVVLMPWREQDHIKCSVNYLIHRQIREKLGDCRQCSSGLKNILKKPWLFIKWMIIVS